MASIKRLSKTRNGLGQHRYQVRFRVKGDRRQRKLTMWATGPDEVERQVALLRGELHDNVEHGLTWAEALPIWYEKAGRQMNEVYAKDYELIVTQFTQKSYEVLCSDSRTKRKAVGWGGAANLSVLATTVQHISDFMDWRRDNRVRELTRQKAQTDKFSGNAAANKARQILLALARTLRDEGVLPRCPFDFEMVAKRPHIRARSRVYDPNLIAQYLDVLPEEARLPVEWMLLTGWRSTATCTLEDANIDESQMLIRKTHKGGKERELPLDETLLGLIYRARALKSQRKLVRSYLFVNLRGGRWSHDTLLQRCQDRWREAGLPQKKIHELRTTFGTEAGKMFSTSKVQAALGHDSPQSTEHYIDRAAMDVAEVGAVVRERLLTIIHQNGTAPVDNGSSEVTVICPELGLKGLVSRKAFLRLLEKAQAQAQNQAAPATAAG